MLPSRMGSDLSIPRDTLAGLVRSLGFRADRESHHAPDRKTETKYARVCDEALGLAGDIEHGRLENDSDAVTEFLKTAHRLGL